MNRAIRRVGIGVTVLMLLLVAQLTYLQVVDAEPPRQRPAQRARFQLRDFNRPAAEIVTADGRSSPGRSRRPDDELQVPTSVPARASCSRRSPATSRSSFGNTGIEQTYNNELSGRDPLLQIKNLR